MGDRATPLTPCLHWRRLKIATQLLRWPHDRWRCQYRQITGHVNIIYYREDGALFTACRHMRLLMHLRLSSCHFRPVGHAADTPRSIRLSHQRHATRVAHRPSLPLQQASARRLPHHCHLLRRHASADDWPRRGAMHHAIGDKNTGIFGLADWLAIYRSFPPRRSWRGRHAAYDCRSPNHQVARSSMASLIRLASPAAHAFVASPLSSVRHRQ